MFQRVGGRRAGLTLVECLVAVWVLGIGLVGVVGCLTAALLGTQKASDTELATAIAQDTIEDMRSRGFGSVTYEEFPASEAVSGLHSGTRAITITDDYGGNSRLKRVAVSVSWRGRVGANARVSLETLISNRAGHSGSG